jgi:hypothetical protein
MKFAWYLQAVILLRSSFILLIKKGRGNGPVKPGNHPAVEKVPTPISDKNVGKEISQIHA